MNCRLPLFLAAVVCIGVASGLVVAAERDEKGIAFFEKKIRPVLVEHCYACHSADAQSLGGKLRLDTKEHLLKGGESGPAVVKNEPKESLLIQALKYESLQMPPKKQLSESVIADFVKWVQMGAPDPRDTLKEGLTSATTELASNKDFWSFQPVRNSKPPAVKNKAWAVKELDRFILAGLEKNKLEPAPTADRRSLIRRLYFDLVGLPPRPDEVEAFMKDRSSTAVQNLVDQLLESPHFGERWGRHWLDIARYGESNGNVRNTTFPHAWRYRDYVIQAFNEDKPYDRFVTEQIAGDLLKSTDPDEQSRFLVATGFLAIGSKPNANGNPNFIMDIVADQIETTTTAILGLTVACARCHDHKYDPIPARDYYSLAGIFSSTETLYGATGNSMGGAPPTDLLALAVDGKFAKPKAVAKDSKEDGGNKKKNKNAKGKNAGAKFTYPDGTPLAMGVRDRANPADCRINIKGEAKQLGATVPRGFVEVCTIGDAPNITSEESGRLQLAQWLTSPHNPLTSRVVVNRIWHHLFGAGIVRSPDNFGLHGDRPTHPELLDYLATKFVADGWSFKRMIREIVLSRTYQMSSQYNEDAYQIDPDNQWVWRHNRRRLDAESFRDTVLAASGRLDLAPAKGSVVSNVGEALIQDKLTPDRIHKPSDHRSIYLAILRNGEPEDLTVFDLADPSLIVGARNVTTVPSQGLFLMNSSFIVNQAEHFAERILSQDDSASDKEEAQDLARIRLAYRETLQREPTSAEIQKVTEFLKRTNNELKDSESSEKKRRIQLWATLGQSLFSTNEFRYVD